MKSLLENLYEGHSHRARLFRTCLLGFDILTIAYFLFTAAADLDVSLVALDLGVGLVILADVAARTWIAQNRLQFL